MRKSVPEKGRSQMEISFKSIFSSETSVIETDIPDWEVASRVEREKIEAAFYAADTIPVMIPPSVES